MVQGVIFAASMLLAGSLYEVVGAASYAAMAVIALAGAGVAAMVWLRMPETKP